MLDTLSVNPAAVIHEETIADEHSCIVIDDFLQNPDAVIEFATARLSEFSMPERSYPGMVLDIAAQPMAEIYRFLRSSMSARFGFLRGGIGFSTMLSMTTLQPDELSNLQRLCHTDPRSRVDRKNFASVLYLFHDEQLGGTAFYRWRDKKSIEKATSLDLDDPDEALAFLKSRFAIYNETPRYMTESNEIAEKLLMIPARFNRLIFYSGDLPHSAWIENPKLLATDPARGRLTLNCFASVRPR